MRYQIGSPPATSFPVMDADPGQPIRQPGRWISVILASFAGVILLFVPVSWLILYSNFIHVGESTYPGGDVPWAGMLLVFFLCILAHEFLHILLYPDSGRSDSTLLFIDWKKIQFGAYYEGRIPRGRWLALRLLPMVILTIFPLLGYHILERWMTFALESYLWTLMLTNSLGSGGDLAAVWIVLWQVPATGTLNFYRGRAYWLPGK